MLQEGAEQVCTAAQLLACEVWSGRCVRHKGRVRGTRQDVGKAEGANVGRDVEIAHLRVGRGREQSMEKVASRSLQANVFARAQPVRQQRHEV